MFLNDLIYMYSLSPSNQNTIIYAFGMMLCSSSPFCYYNGILVNVIFGIRVVVLCYNWRVGEVILAIWFS